MKKLPLLLVFMFLSIGITFAQPPQWRIENDYYQNYDNWSFIKYGDIDEYRTIQDEFWIPEPDVFVKEAKKVTRKLKKLRKHSSQKNLPEIQITSNRRALTLLIEIDNFESQAIDYELVNRKKRIRKSGTVFNDFELSLLQYHPEKYWLNFYDKKGKLLKSYKVFRF